MGDVSIETAGESSRETIFNIDRPQEIADHINEHSQNGTLERLPYRHGAVATAKGKLPFPTVASHAG